MNDEELAGMLLVAGEMLRQRLPAMLYLELSHSCEVRLRHKGGAEKIQIQASRDPRWSLEYNPKERDRSIWILVHLNRNNADPNDYVVLFGSELKEILSAKQHQERQRASIFPSNKNFYISIDEVQNHTNNWGKIRNYVPSAVVDSDWGINEQHS